MSETIGQTLSIEDKDALIFQNRSEVFAKDVTTFAIDSLGKTVVLCGKRGLFFVPLDQQKLDITKTFRDPKNVGKDISGVRWSRNPSILASTTMQELTLWDLGSDKPNPILCKIQCHRRAISGFDWSNHQENIIATASLDPDSLVYLWDTREPHNPVKFHYLRSPFGGASAVKWSRREEHLLAASHGPQLLIWDIRKDSNPLYVIPADVRPILDFDWSYRDDLNILTCSQGSLKFWNLTNPKKAVGSLQTPVIRARYNPFARGCITLTGQANHSWDLWNTSDPSTPFLTKEYGIDDFPELKYVAPMSKFNWRKVLVGSNVEYQVVTWSTKDQSLKLWRIGADEIEASGAEPTKLNKMYSQQYHLSTPSFQQQSSTSNITSGFSTSTDALDYDSDSSNSTATSSNYGSLDFSTALGSNSSMAQNKFGAAMSSPAESSSSASTGSRSRANSNTAGSSSNGGSLHLPMGGSPLTSPPGSSKTASSSSPGSRRVHGQTRQSLPRAVSFEAEIDALMKHPLIGLTLDKMDKMNRTVFFSLRRGKTHVEVRITFPTMYPHGAPPSFSVVTNTSPDSTMKAKQILLEIAEEYVANFRNCLAPAFSQLIEYLGTVDSESITSPIEANVEEHEAALTRHSRKHSNSMSSNAPITSPRANLPPDCIEYVVRPTDSLPAIALFFNMTLGELRKLNKIQHSIQLLPGQLLVVKRPPVQTPPAVSVAITPSVPQLSVPHHPSNPPAHLHFSNSQAEVTPPQLINVKNDAKSKDPARSLSPPGRTIHNRSVSVSNGSGANSNRPSTDALPVARKINNADEVAASPALSSSFVNLIGSPSTTRSRAKLYEVPLSNQENHLYQMKCKFIDRTTNPPQLVSGLMTVTNSQFYFEPDLDSPAVQTYGSLRYTIHLEMKKISQAEDLKSMNLSLTAEDQGVYLQILTKERQPINNSQILLFLGTNLSQVEEISQMMSRWIATKTEKSLMESLNLDATPNVGSVNQTSDLLTRMKSSKHIAGDLIGRAAAGRDLVSLRESSSSLRSSGFLHNPSLSSDSKSDNNSKTEIGTRSSNATKSIPIANSGSSASKPTFDISITPKIIPVTKASPFNISNSPRVPNPKSIPSSLEDAEDLPQLLGSCALLTKDGMLALRNHIPFRYRFHNWKLVFNTSVHGTSLLTFYKNVMSKQPTVLVIKDTDGHIFGGYASDTWRVSRTFFGTGECFLFSLNPNFAVYTWTGADEYFLLGRKDFLAMGGGGASGRYGLWLDSELTHGTSEVCKTFLNRKLSLAEEFTCSSVEVYSLEESV